ncbi:cytochrome-c peroxidase [Flavobacterium amniphilum]|uniref:cytochrome c peroxidase n=1 Tax=Flavobacterium amniphilum TaxID=1834035 RepID=UPI00202A333B|nr:cytochrome c peroxidase [Flavobacterium amniphilum]MCL9804539.1 cytochrome-c peroxidase [Flavobacterium amniphilum]
MKKVLLLLSLLICFSCQNTTYKSLAPIEKTHQFLIINYTDWAKKTTELNTLIDKSFEKEKAQKLFRETRLAYKKIESFVTFYLPETVVKINGAAIDKNDVQETGRKVEEATGFQKVEELLFSGTTDLEALKKEMSILNGYVQSCKSQLINLQLSDSNIFESQKLEMIRLMSLGISGFDSPIALHSLPEAKASIQSIGTVISNFKEDAALTRIINKTVLFVDTNSDFNSFNRGDFITQFCIPISKRIHEIQKELNIKNNPYSGAINFDSATIFEETAFNANFFSPSYNRNPSNEQIDLGEKLFSDSILSGDNSVSCISCHIPSEAYADHKTKAVQNGQLSRNTPTLLNSGFQNTLFLDGRVSYLEDQAKAVINNKDEMHGSFSEALQKVKNNDAYQVQFKKVFPKEKKITEQNLLKSLASYIRSLSKLNSKFDDYLRGKVKLTENEKIGFNVFMGKGKCATCHFFPLFNGSVPPMFTETESEVLGIPSKKNLQNAKVDDDLGEYLIAKAPLKKYAFKTPTVRNSAITFPYMHNGVYSSLNEVIDFYNRGGGSGIGIHLENQTLPTDELNLSKTEINNLIVFLKTLNNKY